MFKVCRLLPILMLVVFSLQAVPQKKMVEFAGIPWGCEPAKAKTILKERGYATSVAQENPNGFVYFDIHGTMMGRVFKGSCWSAPGRGVQMVILEFKGIDFSSYSSWVKQIRGVLVKKYGPPHGKYSEPDTCKNGVCTYEKEEWVLKKDYSRLGQLKLLSMYTKVPEMPNEPTANCGMMELTYFGPEPKRGSKPITKKSGADDF